jgi:protein-tyrosine-phosphatase
MREGMLPIPLFVCHANCCRSVLGKYLYEHLFSGSHALSAGIAAGDEINDRACAMLQSWGIDARDHRPRQLDRGLCDRADAIFLMGPEYLRLLLERYGEDLAEKAYLFADPFTMPRSFADGEYLVYDPSFEGRPISELAAEFSWFRVRTAEIHEALRNGRFGLIPASRYQHLL